jgi:hypothetical protein
MWYYRVNQTNEKTDTIYENMQYQTMEKEFVVYQPN